MVRSETSAHFRIVYIACQDIVSDLANQLFRVGAERVDGGGNAGRQQFAIGQKLVSAFTRFGLNAPAIYGAQVYFFSDPVAAVEALPGLDPELVLYDERQQFTVFEDFLKSLLDLTPRSFHLPLRRVLVIHEDSPGHEQRSFQLGTLGVRGAILSPRSAVRLFALASRELLKMWEKFDRTSVCISGGGVEGYLYALGVARALEVAFVSQKLKNFDIYCGVSSGAILASCLAAGLSTEDLLKQIYRRPGLLEPMTPKVVFDFATAEILKRMWSFIRSLPGADIPEVVTQLQRLVPVGFFRGEKLKTFIERQFERIHVADRFSALNKELYISATDQDTGEHIVFGQEPWRDIRISQAIRASAALPPFYLPERIKGHWFADGQLTSSSDIKMALARGAGLVILIDPMVAYTSNSPGAVQSRGGFFATIQAIKSLVQSRFQSMWKHAMDIYPDVDFVLFQPTDAVMEAMAGNPMRYRIRTELTELGYLGAIGQILQNYDALSHKLQKHGFDLKPAAELEAILNENLDLSSSFLRSSQ